MNAQTGIIDIRGKSYQTVALRVQLFREQKPDWSLETEIVARDADSVAMKAYIADETGRILATGHAEEYRNSSQINKTSALENAETSAIGRALAALGYGGTEFATANEVQNAIHQQDNPPPKKQAAHSALKSRLRSFVHEMNGCGDGNELSAFLATADSVKLIQETREKLPHLWDGNDWPESIERPEEFVPLADQITKRQRECAEVSAQYLNA